MHHTTDRAYTRSQVTLKQSFLFALMLAASCRHLMCVLVAKAAVAQCRCAGCPLRSS